MGKHTKGPWEVYYYKPGHAPWVRTHLGEHVTSVDSDITDDLEANARLIAAAPELLEACREVAAGQLDNDPPERFIARMREVCRAAIAKAKGQS